MPDNFENWSKRSTVTTFKMFVWLGLDSMREYSSGLAFGYAQTKEQAINAILIEQYPIGQYTIEQRLDSYLFRELSSSEPFVFDNIVSGFAIRGST